MSILWCGGEDIDFPFGGPVSTYATYARSGYTRLSVCSSSFIKSSTFTGITSGWVHCSLKCLTWNTSLGIFGLLNFDADKGIAVRTSSSNGSKIELCKFDQGTWTSLAVESGTSFSGNGFISVDISFSSWGASTAISVYINGTGTPVIDGTYDLSSLSVASLDCASVYGSGTSFLYMAEVIVADEDTRTMSLVTLAPSASGDTSDWTGAYTDIDETTLSDTDNINSNTNDQVFQCGLTNTPAGSFVVRAVKIAARASKGSSGVATLKLGVKSGSTTDVDAGQTVGTYFKTFERLMSVNPVTSSAFTAGELDSLQLTLKAGT